MRVGDLSSYLGKPAVAPVIPASAPLCSSPPFIRLLLVWGFFGCFLGSCSLGSTYERDCLLTFLLHWPSATIMVVPGWVLASLSLLVGGFLMLTLGVAPLCCCFRASLCSLPAAAAGNGDIARGLG